MRQVAEMIELASARPDVNVSATEYTRLLGFPRGWVMEGRALELADWARDWYAKNGRPWIYARQAESLEMADGFIHIDGMPFTSKRLQSTLQQAEAHSVILVAVGAGPEAEEEARQRWEGDKPDEYFFLEMYSSAVVEHLTTVTGANLCDWAERHEMAVLPHYSPGYPEWDIADQPQLLELVRRTRKQPLPSRIEVLESGMLRPKKSLLAVFGLTRHTDRLRRLTELVPCEACSYTPCQYRRAPYRRASRAGGQEVPAPAPVLNNEAAYSVNTKALKRWTDERLSIRKCEDGTIEALFRYDGTTCTNMGRSLSFDYSVKLGPRAAGYPILKQRCAPAAGDTGYTQMCKYLENPELLMVSIESEKPLHGQRLEAVLSWPRAECAAGCYCEPASREHKWGLVFETIHYALVQMEREQDARES
ncbi:MAG: hypothetical protein WBF35_14195 [Candidatus Acidiferrales bacterium]